MLDYNDIMVESTGQELHEVLVPKVARFMYIKNHPTLRIMAWYLNKKEYEEFINTEARKLRKFGQDLGMPESTIHAFKKLIRNQADLAHAIAVGTNPLDGVQWPPLTPPQEKAAVHSNPASLNMEYAVPWFPELA